MTVTATEFKTNFGKYMELVKTEEIIVTKNGKMVGVFSNKSTGIVDSMIGMFPGIKEYSKDYKERKINEEYK